MSRDVQRAKESLIKRQRDDGVSYKEAERRATESLQRVIRKQDSEGKR